MVDFKQEVLKRKEEMIKDIESLVNIDSVYDESTIRDQAPYGAGCRKALDQMLAIGKRDGFKTHDEDGYAGHIDIGTGDKTFGILAHLDVVPVNSVGWKTDPFKMVEKDGLLYGRGVSDDKGPLIAGYYAAKIINDLDIPTKMKTRIIFGCDEERGSSCLEHYFTKQEYPEMGFTPDAEFPVVYGEKAPVDFKISGEIEKDGLIYLCAGTRANIVPETCEAIVEGNIKEYKDSFKKFLKDNNLEGTIDEEGNHTSLTLKGKSAHASTPDEGINAVTMLCKYLHTVTNNKLVDFVCKYIDTTGKLFNIDKVGQMGALTLNLGIICFTKGQAKIELDLRCPHECDFDKMVDNVSKAASQYSLKTNPTVGKALYVDPNSELITKLHHAYKEVTGENDEPQAIGGGTYAKKCPNSVAFGAEFKGQENFIHGNNEQVYIDSLLKATEIYCLALYEIIKK